MSARFPKLKLQLAGPPPPKCGEHKGGRSTVHCELPPDHANGHLGRTRGGYWKSWPR